MGFVMGFLGLGSIASVLAAVLFYGQLQDAKAEVARLRHALRNKEERRKEDSVKAYNAGKRDARRW